MADGLSFVAAKIVRDDHIARRERGNQHFFDIDPEARTIDWVVEKPWSFDPIVPQGSNERHRIPVAIRHLGVEPCSPRCPTA